MLGRIALIYLFFKPMVTYYNLRGSGLNVSQPSYNNRFMQNSFSYFIAHVWNKLPLSTKSAPTNKTWVFDQSERAGSYLYYKTR